MYTIGNEEVEAVRRVVESGQMFRYGDEADGHLNEVVKFEKEWAAFTGARYCVCTTSGSASLVCGLAALGIGPGDEVIIPGYTYIATALTVLNVGAIPVIVDVDETCTMDPQSIRKYISKHTRAIIPVHMGGMPCDMEAIEAIAREHDLLILEDACQAVGGRYRGRPLGTIGQMGAFSFNYYKIISAGESGAVITSDRRLMERAFMQHDGGCHLWTQVQKMNEDAFAGGNFRSNEVAGAILRIQLSRLPGILESLRATKQFQAKHIEPTDRVWIAKYHDLEGDCGVQTLFTTDSESTMRALMAKLKEAGMTSFSPIDTGRHVYCNWIPIMNRSGSHHPLTDPYKMEANKDLNMDCHKDSLPQTLDVLARSLTIRHPIGKSDDERARDVEFINKVIRDL